MNNPVAAGGLNATDAEVLAALENVLASKSFAGSPRLTRFLRFVVEQTLAGNAADLKEYKLGLDVFDRGQDFDPRMDAVVRVEARQVRFKLTDYYSGAGAIDPLIIHLPKGAYTARFERRASPVLTEPELMEAAPPPRLPPFHGALGLPERRRSSSRFLPVPL